MSKPKHNGMVVVWQETESKVYRPFAFRFNKAIPKRLPLAMRK